MEYFKLLDLKKEPFSTSPDPVFFYESHEHKECLNRLEIAIRLRRGLSVVMGEVGTATSPMKVLKWLLDNTTYGKIQSYENYVWIQM